MLLGISMLSWAYVASMDDHGMDVGVLLQPRTATADETDSMTMDMPGMDMSGMDMTPAAEEDHGMSLPVFLTGWVVMMAAMMFPAVIPVVLLVSRWSRSQAQPPYRLAAFVGGYLLVWGAAGAVYFAAIDVIDSRFPSGPDGVRLAAAMLLLAGVYQLTPLKEVCLTACRSPMGFLMTHGSRMSRGSIGYLEVGARHGLFCLGCCWMLMLILVLLGVMNLFWMAVIAGVIFLEKVVPAGPALARFAGAAVIACGAALLISPALVL